MRTTLEKIIYYSLNPHLIFNDLNVRKESKLRAEELKDYNSRYPFVENNTGFLQRKYKDTAEYLSHQKSKLKIVKNVLDDSYEERVTSFMEEFSLAKVQKTQSVLCLGSRDGAEVDAVRRMGALGIGIDLEYPSQSPFVHYGNFHEIPYPENCFDFVYTNTLDHLEDPSVLFAEIKKVLKPSGQFIGRILKGVDEGFNLKGSHESFVWKTKDQLINLIEENGFKLKFKANEDSDWTVVHFDNLPSSLS
jgi:SAM-dependent methyltransferase